AFAGLRRDRRSPHQNLNRTIAQNAIFKAPLTQMEMMLPCQFLVRRAGFRFQRRGDDDASDAMAGNELRQVAQSAQYHVPMNPVEMQRRLVVYQHDNGPTVKTLGVVKAAF